MKNLAKALPLILIFTVALLGGCSDSSSPPRGGDEAVEQPHEVGSTTLFIHDETRPFDAVAGITTGIRVLIAEVWYPVDPADIDDSARHPTYGDYVFGDEYVHRRMMTETTFYHLTPETVRPGVTQEQIDAAIAELFHRERNSYLDAPPSRGASPFPVIVMSHGDAGSRYNMETVCESLARNGYVVIAPEHTGNSPFSMIGKDPALHPETGDPAFIAAMADVLPLIDEHGVYGADAPNGQTYAAFQDMDLAVLDASLIERLNDLRATLAELTAMNESGPFARILDLDRIGLMGRSFGGATTLVGLELEDRFKAGVAVVPPSIPDIRGLVRSLPPEGQESALLSPGREPAMMALNKPTLLMNCREDSTIISLNLLAALLTSNPRPSAQDSHPALRKAFEHSDAPVVWTMLSNANHGSYAVSGPYFWPDLKPDTFLKNFSLFQTYTLIDAGLAHKIQIAKVNAFFDLVFKNHKEKSFNQLISDEFEQSGLELEYKNLDF